MHSEGILCFFVFVVSKRVFQLGQLDSEHPQTECVPTFQSSKSKNKAAEPCTCRGKKMEKGHFLAGI